MPEKCKSEFHRLFDQAMAQYPNSMYSGEAGKGMNAAVIINLPHNAVSALPASMNGKRLYGRK
jgi:hypothetical protein